jgi:hypothetical protein
MTRDNSNSESGKPGRVGARTGLKAKFAMSSIRHWATRAIVSASTLPRPHIEPAHSGGWAYFATTTLGYAVMAAPPSLNSTN